MKQIFTLVLFLFSFCSYSQITITTDSVIQTGTCAGSTIIVRYKAAGGSFGSGNKFTAQLSNAFGQFTNPVPIGASNFNTGFILASLPKNATFGFFYRVRVVSSNPSVTGTPSPNTVLITSTALTATINTPDGLSICPGDSVRLQAFLPNGSYQWSTGATTQSIRVGQPGTYWVKVTDPFGCDARDTVQISEKQGCQISNSGVIIYPNPVKVTAQLHLRGVPSGYQLQFIDFMGRMVAILPVYNQRVHLSGAHIPSGVYILRLVKNDELRMLGKLMLH